MFGLPDVPAREALRGAFLTAVLGALMCGSNLPGLLRAARHAAEDREGLVLQALSVALGLLVLVRGAMWFRRALDHAAPAHGPARPSSAWHDA